MKGYFDNAFKKDLNKYNELLEKLFTHNITEAEKQYLIFLHKRMGHGDFIFEYGYKNN